MGKMLLYSQLPFHVFFPLKSTQSEEKLTLPVSIPEIPND